MEQLEVLARNWLEGSDNEDGSVHSVEYSKKCEAEFSAKVEEYAARHNVCENTLFDVIMDKIYS